MFRRTRLAFPLTTRRRKEREAARPKLIFIYKPPPIPEMYPFHESKVCTLCHMRVRNKEVWAKHEESPGHQARLKWRETMKNYKDNVEPKIEQKAWSDWAWYRKHVLERKAALLNVPLEDLERKVRKATMIPNASSDRLDYPAIRAPIPEPKDMRWPAARRTI